MERMDNIISTVFFYKENLIVDQCDKYVIFGKCDPGLKQLKFSQAINNYFKINSEHQGAI